MSVFEKFLIDNKLKKYEIAEFLDVSPSFITQLCNETRPLPDDKRELIIANKAWDTSLILALDKEQGNNTPDATELEYDALVQSLVDRIKSLEEKIEWMQGIIDKLTDK